MGDNDASFGKLRREPSKFAGDVLVAQPVKPVAAHALVIKRTRYREGIVHPGVAAVECRIETPDLPDTRKGLDRRANAGEVMRLVQGRKRRKLGELFQKHAIDK
jgi:hypothetical protein